MLNKYGFLFLYILMNLYYNVFQKNMMFTYMYTIHLKHVCIYIYILCINIAVAIIKDFNIHNNYGFWSHYWTFIVFLPLCASTIIAAEEAIGGRLRSTLNDRCGYGRVPIQTDLIVLPVIEIFSLCVYIIDTRNANTSLTNRNTYILFLLFQCKL